MVPRAWHCGTCSPAVSGVAVIGTMGTWFEWPAVGLWERVVQGLYFNPFFPEIRPTMKAAVGSDGARTTFPRRLFTMCGSRDRSAGFGRRNDFTSTSEEGVVTVLRTVGSPDHR